jgi:hypothetical protein
MGLSMSIINTALIGKLKKTKADKSNVLQLDNTTAFTPVTNYQPATKKYVDDAVLGLSPDTNTYVQSAQLQPSGILELVRNDNVAVGVDLSPLQLKSISDQHIENVKDYSTGLDIPVPAGYISTAHTLNYTASIWINGTPGISVPTSPLSGAMTVETWFYHDGTSQDFASVFELNSPTQSIKLRVSGEVVATDTLGMYAMVGTQMGSPVGTGWHNYVLQFNETQYTTWIDGTRRAFGNFPVVGSEDYRQTVAKTSYVIGSTSGVNIHGWFDGFRIVDHATFTFNAVNIPVNGILSNSSPSVLHAVHALSQYNAVVGGDIFVNTPTADNNPATKLYVDTLVSNSTNPYIVSGFVNTMGQFLRLTNNDSSVVDINISSLITPDWGQTLYTTSDVHFNSVITPFADIPNININNAISFGTVSGSPNQVIITKSDGTSWWSDVKTINGQSLIGSGNITISAAGQDKFVASGAVIGTTLRLTNNDASTVDINVSALFDDTTNTVSSGVLTGNVIRFTRQDGTTFDVNVAALYDDTNLVTSVNGQTGAITITDTNNYLSGATLNGTTLTLARSGLSNLTVDLSSLKTTDTDNYVDSATLSGNTLILGRSGSLPDLTVDLSTLHGVDTDNYIDSAVLSGTTLVLGRTGTLPDLTVDLSSLGGGTGGTINSLIRRQQQDFIATSGQTVFTTTFTLYDVEVFYNGFKLDNSDYTFVGHTLTLLEAAQAGDNIEIIDYGNAVSVDAAYEKYALEITQPTSVFNVVYAIGQVEVFLNGMKLADTEYTAIDGQTITITPPVQAGDYVEIITMIATTSGNYYTKAEVDQMIAGAGTGSSTTTGLTTQVIDTFSTNNYRSGEYLLTVTGSGFMTLKMLVLFNGTVALNSQYGQLGDDLGTFDTLLNGTNVQVLFTPIDQNSTVQFSRTLIENIGGGSTQTLPSDLNTGSGTIDLNSGSGTIDLNGTIIPNDLNSGSGTIDLLVGTGTNDLNQ